VKAIGATWHRQVASKPMSGMGRRAVASSEPARVQKGTHWQVKVYQSARYMPVFWAGRIGNYQHIGGGKLRQLRHQLRFGRVGGGRGVSTSYNLSAGVGQPLAENGATVAPAIEPSSVIANRSKHPLPFDTPGIWPRYT